MIVSPVNKITIYQPSFLNKSILKTEFIDGKIPLKKDITGAPLNKDNLSVDHTIPKSKGGKSTLYNYSLMNKRVNNLRGSDRLKRFIDVESLVDYIRVMLDVKTEGLDGVDYIRKWLKNLSRELKR